MAPVDVEGVTLRRGGSPLLTDLSLHVDDGELMALVGPSGSGKTTLLRVLAGLEQVDEGVVRIGGRDVTDVPAAQRDVAMVMQEGGLQPHLTARGNIAFPLRMRRDDRDLVDERVVASARVMDLEELLDRLPRQLSAGSRQAVETTRELGRTPAVFLLDEPLASVDAQRRMRLRRELSLIQRRARVTMLYATNDQAEAMAVGDRIAVLVDGALMQVGAPMDVHEHPATVTVASLIGSPPINLLPGVAQAGGVRVGGALVDLVGVGAGVDGEVVVGVRPADLHPEPLRDGLHVRLEIARVTETGPEVHVRGRVGERGIRAVLRVPLTIPVPSVGDRLDLYAPAERLLLFDARTGVACA